MKSIIDLAKQSGLTVGTNISGVTLVGSPSTPGIAHITTEELERFAALVRAHALEEAAGVCENTLAQHYMKQVIPTHDEALLLAACADCAAAIRQLKEQT